MSDPSLIRLRRALPVAGIFLLAYVLRLIYLRHIANTPYFDLLDLDPLYYYQWAANIAGGDWLGEDVFEQSPLYPYLLAAFLAVFGDDLWLLRLLQIGVGSVTCVLVFLLTQSVFDRRTGIVAGVGAALYAPFYFYEGQVMKEFLTPPLAAGSLWLLVRRRPPSGPALAAAGALLGLAALVRDNFLLLLPALAAWLLVDRRGALRPACFFLAGALTVLAPVALRNYAVSGDLVLTTTGGGEVFYIGNGPYATGAYAPPPWVRPRPPSEHEDFRRKANELAGRELTRAEASRFWWRQGFQWMVQHPVDAAVLWLRKFVFFWSDRELPDNYSFYTFRELSWLLGWLLTFGPVAAMAWAGIVLTFDQRHRLLPLHVAGAAYMLSVLLVFNFARFRLPMTVMLLPFAARFVTALAEEAWRDRHGTAIGRRLRTAAVVLCVSVPLFWPYRTGVESEYAVDRLRVAIAHWEQDRLDEAEHEARAAVADLERQASRTRDPARTHGTRLVPSDAQEPPWATARRLLAAVLLARGENGLAADEFRHVLNRMPNNSRASVGLAEALRAGGDWDGAAAAYRQALDARPESFDDRLRLATLYGDMGQTQNALYTLNAALLVPADLTADQLADYHYTAAAVLSAVPGREADVAAHLNAAIRLAPGRSEISGAEKYLRLMMTGGT